MKRILALLLCLATLLSFASCAKEPANETKTLETQETKEEITKKTEEKKTEEESGNNDANTPVANVVDKDVRAKLDAIPIANSSMTPDQLRQICVDFFKLQLSFSWTPSETLEPVSTENDGQKLRVEINKGTVYGGIPYTSTGSGNLYRALDYYDDETGVIDLSFFRTSRDKFVNACSGSANWAWGRVVNSAYLSWTQYYTQYQGCINVGPYTYSKDIKMFSSARSDSAQAYTAKNVVLENGEQVMYQSYAQMKPADGITHPGHIRMNTAVPHVEYNADGTINGDESYTYYCDQQLYVIADTQSDGSPKTRQGGVDVKVTFKELYDRYYIPFTFAEFLGTDPVEDGTATLTLEDAPVTASSISALELSKTKLTTNYAISGLYVKVLDDQGTVKLTRKVYPDDHYTESMGLSSALVSSFIKMMNTYAGCTVEVSARISTGAIITAYSGTLIGE